MGVGIVRLFRGKDAVNDRRQRGFRYFMAIVPPTRGDLIDRSNVPGSPTGGIHEFPPAPPRTSRRISLTLCRACGCGV
jgi:hypothetical protein